MPTLQATAYPRLKTSVSAHDLTLLYTPTSQEVAVAERATRGDVALLGFLVLLKTCQRLGYFVLVSQVPAAIVEHIAQATGTQMARDELAGYDTAGTRFRHLHVIRDYLQIRPCGPKARRAMLQAMQEAALTKEALADLVNVGIEELVRQKYELPAFDILVRGARHVRAVLYRRFYCQVDETLSEEEKACLDSLLVAPSDTRFMPWNLLKQEPGSPTLTHLKVWLDRQDWLARYPVREAALAGIPDVKVKHFAGEARTLDAARMLQIEPHKRRTLAVSLLKVQSAHALDDLAEMLLKRIASLHKKGKEALADYHLRNQQRADELVRTLHDLVTAFRTEGNAQERIAVMATLLPNQGEAVLQRCEDHMAHSGDNYLPFVWRFYKSHRATLFRLLKSLSVKATTQDTTLEQALRFLLENEARTGDWLTFPKSEDEEAPALDLSWMPEGWWRLVTAQRHRDEAPTRLNGIRQRLIPLANPSGCRDYWCALLAEDG